MRYVHQSGGFQWTERPDDNAIDCTELTDDEFVIIVRVLEPSTPDGQRLIWFVQSIVPGLKGGRVETLSSWCIWYVRSDGSFHADKWCRLVEARTGHKTFYRSGVFGVRKHV